MPILVFVSLFTLLDFVILFSIGSQIGLLITLLLVIGTGVVGLHLIRKEGSPRFPAPASACRQAKSLLTNCLPVRR